MARKGRVVFVCQQCGSQNPRWAGRCADCGAWNSLVESVEAEQPASARPAGVSRSEPVALPKLVANRFDRIPVPIAEFSRVLGGGIVPGSVVLIGGDPGIGKCVTGDTRVLDPTSGAYEPITAWASGGRDVLAIDDEALALQRASVSQFHERGVRPVVEVTTELGRVIRCTPDHPVLTTSGWRPVRELPLGTHIAAPRQLPHFGKDSLPEAAVKLVAYVLSDGSAQSQISVTSNLPEVAADVSNIADAYGMQLSVYPKAGSSATQYRFVIDREQRRQARQQVSAALHATRRTAAISWQEWARRAEVSYAMLNSWRRGRSVPDSKNLGRLAATVGVSDVDLAPEARARAEMKTPIARFLEETGLRYSHAADKHVPGCVFTLPREQIATFLRVLFSCDGSVYINAAGQPGISYSTISHRLALDVQHLLLRFGLVAKLRTKNTWVAGRPYTAYEVILLGLPVVRRFLDDIGIYGRQEARAAVAAMVSPDLPSTRRDVIPTDEAFWKRLRLAVGDEGFVPLSRRAGVTIKDRRPDRPICRSTVERLADALNEPRLHALAYGDVYWDSIVDVKEIGEQPVFDLTVPGPANFVANDLIVHNSTLLAQVSSAVADGVGPVLYVSGEESADQIRLRAERLGITSERLYILSETCVDVALGHIETLRPSLVIVDSIQTAYLESIASSAGSISQVRECATALLRMAKATQTPVFLVGHVTKEGSIAGPRALEHIVDTVLYLEGERFHTYRLLRSVKNRFGSTNEIGVFEMREEGMAEVANPSAVFLAERQERGVGSAVAVPLEGTRPLLVEVQALTTTTTFGLPRRTGNGVDFNRLLLLAAVLSKQVGLALANQDVYVNVVGGIKVGEPAADLAVALAIASSYRERPVDSDLAVIGEIGLSGELRRVTQVEKRLAEASKLGFKRCLLPRSVSDDRRLARNAGIELIGASTLHEAISLALGEAEPSGRSRRE